MKMTRRARFDLVGVAVLAAFAMACDDDDGMGPDGNQDPVAMIQANPTTVPAGDNNQTIVTLDGSGSSDPDGDALTFMWAATSVTFRNGTSATSEIAEVSFPGAAPYLVTLTVSDGNGGTDQAQVTIALGAPDGP